MHQHHRNRQNKEELRSETLKENYLGMLYCRWQRQLGFLDSIFTTTTLELPLRMSRLKLRTSMASMFLCAKGNLIALPDSTLYVALSILGASGHMSNLQRLERDAYSGHVSNLQRLERDAYSGHMSNLQRLERDAYSGHVSNLQATWTPGRFFDILV
ncbi:hypothetical protein LWI29_034933 [Acer saccharum]|uniref:Uncharacterized protein n=1 Tax=Acer saccharum TaxID=4024 RepID=A0AA39S127_ACESA|nr:hypothetical protein LWI29_034933 [Acer saccharum]